MEGTLARGQTALLVVSLALGSMCLTVPSQAYDWQSWGGHEYALTSSWDTWLSNEAEAVEQGGHLVTINSAAENAWLTSVFAYTSTRYGHLLADIGYYQNSATGQWQWVSGEAVTYTSLYSGFPQGGTHSYTHLASPYESSYNGRWNANPYHTEGPDAAYGIIERGLAPATPELSTWALLACTGVLGAAVRRRRKP